MPLTDSAIKAAKHKAKQYKMYDERGMYLLVSKSGKYFRFDYRFNGKRRTLALGVYPDISLKQARDFREDARRNIANGVDPGELRKVVKQAKIDLEKNSFEIVATEWFTKKSADWTEKHSKKVLSRLKRDVFPYIGNKNISDITAVDLLNMLRKVEARGSLDTAYRINWDCSKIFMYAIADQDRPTDRNPATDLDLKSIFGTVKSKSFASITDPKQITELLAAINGYSGSHIVLFALKLAPIFFVRPGELRHAEWTEFDFNRKEWRIPADKMKMRRQHIVPLSSQAINLLEALQRYTGNGRYLFPSMRTDSRPMSDNTINAALRRLGYSREEMTCHGFRTMASTSLHEHDWPSDAIERQLAHTEGNAVKAVYNHAQHMQVRRKMMQAWSDYLDFLQGDLEGNPLFYEDNK